MRRAPRRREVEAPAAGDAPRSTLAEPPRGRPARFWIGTARGENGKSKVTFAWEPIPPVPGERRPGDESVSHVLVDRPLAGRPAALPRARSRAERRGAPPPAPGAGAARRERDLRGSAGTDAASHHGQNATGQVIDSSTSDVTVPDYTKPQVSLGTPRLFRARTPRDVQALKANPAAAPSSDRDVRAHRAAVRPRRRLRARDRAA